MTNDTAIHPLILTKLYRPRAPEALVPRIHVFQRLQRSFHMPLTLVAAPAGSGKSLVVTSWLESCD